MRTLEVLDADEVQRVHAASLRILERVGVELPHEEMRKRFAAAGARVGGPDQRVRIPPALVADCLRQAGKEFVLRGRDPARSAAFGRRQRNYNAIAGEAHWIDDETGRRRYATIEDVRTAARFCDGLDGLNIAGAMADPHDIPAPYRCVAVAAEMIKNTTKPITFWFHDRASARFVLEIFSAAGGGPAGYPFLEPISPLHFPFHGVDLLFETCKVPLPVPIGPMAQVGLSAPGTLAGTLAQENAEILAGICITQLIRPGTPVCYGGIPHAFDMARTQLVFAGPEQILMAVAMTQIGKGLYGLPVYINVGLTDSKCVDAQAGLEAGMTLLSGALAGADIFGHFGICGADQATSLDILVMQNEIIHYVERVCRGVEVNDDTLALDIIEEVGPGGTFIDREHTARHFRKELWFPRLLDRNFYQAWADSGGRGMDQRCREEKRRLLAGHRPEPPSEPLVKELDRIVAAARKHCCNPGA